MAEIKELYVNYIPKGYEEKLAAQERINFLRESRIELQKRYQETVKISQIAALLDSSGVGITAGPPFEI